MTVMATTRGRLSAKIRHRLRRATGRPDVIIDRRGLSPHARAKIADGTAPKFTPGRGRFTQPPSRSEPVPTR